MITSVKTTVTINSSQIVHWGSEFGTMCGAGAGFGKKIKDSQATAATCKRCVKLIDRQIELAYAEAVRMDEERTMELAHELALEVWDAAHDEHAERAMAIARNLDVWLEEGMVLISPMLDGGLFVFERFGRDGAELREMRTGILHMVSQSYVTTWKYVPRPVELSQVWRSKETGALVRIIDTSREDVRLIGLDAEDVPFWLSRSMLAEHFVWVPQKIDAGEAGR